MLLSYGDLVDLVHRGVIDALPENINGASIDVRLGETILIEKSAVINSLIDISNKQDVPMISMQMSENGYALSPGQFILAATMETFNLPDNICCEFKLKSSVARAGLNNMLATWCDPNWSNSRLTLELKNDLQYNSLLIKPGMKIGQMIFYRVNPVPYDKSYAVKGRYNNTTEVTASKGV